MKLVLAVLTALFVLIPFCYIPASAAVFVVKERTSKAQHLQLVSGVSASYYWLATYAWDYAMYCLMSAACMLIFVLYDEPGYVGDADQACYPHPTPHPNPHPHPSPSPNHHPHPSHHPHHHPTPSPDADQACCTLLLLLLYGLAALPMVYCYSFGFESHSTAQIVVMVVNLIMGFVTVIAHFVMSTLPSTQDADKVLVHLYRLMPPYVFGESLLSISSTWYQVRASAP